MVKNRDLRVDLLRGLAMILVITIHLEYYSVYSFIVWGRLGFVSSAEGFVFLSGLVAGIVYGRKIEQEGFRVAATKLLRRALQLYIVNVVVILSIPLLSLIPHVDVYAVTHWLNSGTGVAYPTYKMPFEWVMPIVKSAMLLRAGPHQFQIIGLYVFLMLLSPLAIWLIHKRLWIIVLAVSWACYFLNDHFHLRITHAGFEWGFPLLTWQLLFFNAMVFGANFRWVNAFFANRYAIWIVLCAGILWFLFILLALNNPHPIFFPGPVFFWVEPNAFFALTQQWFLKTPLGLGRILNNMVIFTTLWFLLTRYWSIAQKWIGWLLIPLGQASLYVFILHVYFLLVVSNLGLPRNDYFWLNTVVHTAVILSIWYMVQRRVLFSVIPR